MKKIQNDEVVKSGKIEDDVGYIDPEKDETHALFVRKKTMLQD